MSNLTSVATIPIRIMPHLERICRIDATKAIGYALYLLMRMDPNPVAASRKSAADLLRQSLPLTLALIFSTNGLLADAVDDYVEKRRNQDNVPGISIAVVRDGKIEKARGYGQADVELNVPATEHTVYQWASVTKQFTATAIMLPVIRGSSASPTPPS